MGGEASACSCFLGARPSQNVLGQWLLWERRTFPGREDLARQKGRTDHDTQAWRSAAGWVLSGSRAPWVCVRTLPCALSPGRQLTSSSAHSEGSTVWEGRQNCWHTPRL